MKKILAKAAKASLILPLVFLAFSCTSTQLYNWEDYQVDYYKYIKNADTNSMDNLARTYEEIINDQDEARGVVPPGIYADYGWLLIEAGKTEEGKAMLRKEMELYPESKTFVGSILKRLEK